MGIEWGEPHFHLSGKISVLRSFTIHWVSNSSLLGGSGCLKSHHTESVATVGRVLVTNVYYRQPCYRTPIWREQVSRQVALRAAN